MTVQASPSSCLVWLSSSCSESFSSGWLSSSSLSSCWTHSVSSCHQLEKGQNPWLLGEYQHRSKLGQASFLGSQLSSCLPRSCQKWLGVLQSFPRNLERTAMTFEETAWLRSELAPKTFQVFPPEVQEVHGLHLLQLNLPR